MGTATLDDAGVVRLSDELALVYTADFITPIVDDPFAFGRIAAANALSDVYAMGGTPLCALNLVAWPADLDPDILAEVLRGGQDAAREADCLIVGGHTIHDDDPKYGLSVTGTVRPDRILRNVGARPGDVLFLTKPLGTGVLATAGKAGVAPAAALDAMIASMSRLNRGAAAAALAANAHAGTDVTGFGLAGHLREMLLADRELGVELHVDRLPLLPGVLEHIAGGMVPAGAYRNRQSVSGKLELAPGVDDVYALLVCDPQTSGGLAVAVAPAQAEGFVQRARAHDLIAGNVGVFDRSGRIRLCRSSGPDTSS